MLPRVLSCKHAFEEWDKINKYFNAHMKAIVWILCVKLKSIKKGNNSITEHVFRVKDISNVLLAIGDVVSE